MPAHSLTGAPAAAGTTPDARWLRRLTPPGRAPAVRLICFPHAGGAAGAFAPLARALDPSVDALGVQYPGRQDRRHETPLDIPGLADRIADALTDDAFTDDAPAHSAGGPYAFFGHSMGALVAFETAARLRDRPGTGPVHLFLSGRLAPGLGPVPADRLEGDDALVARVLELGGVSGEILADPELKELVLVPLRADYRALRSYAWAGGPPLDLPCTVLTGDADPLVPVGDAAAWARHTTGPTALRVFPGGHFYLADRAADVARAVTADLAGAPDPAPDTDSDNAAADTTDTTVTARPQDPATRPRPRT
ncbi:thioesterase II family protein [Streptomyces sp. NPDC058953]|uniref:thioesterase II family protein n=1 Tax=unclassified Streptomyces TaxID=2593676 RepID=UPI0036A31EE0